MRVVILVAGMGSRHKPLTNVIPKCLIEVEGKPILGHILDWVKPMDFSEICMVVGMFRPKIEAYIRDSYDFGDKVRYVKQSNPVGTAQAVGLALVSVSESPEPVLVVLGDCVPSDSVSGIFMEWMSVPDAEKPPHSIISLRESTEPEQSCVVNLYSPPSSCMSWVCGFDEKPKSHNHT